MSILDVTEDQIFQTLGKGKDPNFKPIEKVRPVVVHPAKPQVPLQTRKPYAPKPIIKTVVPTLQKAVEPVKQVIPPEVEENMMKLSVEMNELNTRVKGIHSMVKWYIVPQFVVVLALIVVLLTRS